MEILNNIVKWIIPLAIWLIACSCNSPEAFDCFKKAGELETIEFDDLPNFKTVVLHDDIELEIVESGEEYFELVYGKNLIPKIAVELVNDSILFRNQNFCGWTRDYVKPKLKWFTTSNNINVISMSNGLISANDTLRNDLIIRMENSTSEINLKIANNSTTLLSNSSSNFYVSGTCKNLNIAAYFNDGKYDCSNFIAKSANVLQRGYNDIIVHVKDSLAGSIENAGRIFYTGNPTVNVNVKNGGELIHLDQE